MLLSNQTYNQLKWIALIALPALASFAAGMGQVFEWTYTQQLVQTINLVTVFLGSLLQLSSHHYHQGPGGGGLVTSPSPH